VPADLHLIALDASGNTLGELTSAVSRRIQFALDGPATCSFTVPGRHPEATLLTEAASDIVVRRAGQNLFRGRLSESNDTLSADVHTVAFAAVDYRGLLDRRILWSDSPLSFRGVDQGQIAWTLIADSQRRPGGNLGVVQGTGTQTGVARDRDFAPGQKLGELITQLGEVIGGFDWEIDANLAFNVFYPQRGRSAGLELVYGQQVSDATRQVTTTAYATALRYQGDPAATVAVEVSDPVFGPSGRWEAAPSDPNLKLQTSVSDAANAYLAASDTLIANYRLTLLEGWWTGTAALWLGDLADLYITSGRLNVTGTQYRVVGVQIDYSDDGGETVSVDVGVPPASLTARLGDYQSRLETIERTLTAPAGYVLDAPVGAMFSWPGGSPPQTWAWADGSGYSKTTYPELFNILGYTFGGAGDLFALPDCRSRMVVAAGAGAGLSARAAGATGGAETVALTAATTGAHAHGFSASTGANSVDHAHSFDATTGNETAQHNHLVSGPTGGHSADHTHALGFNWQAAQPGSGTLGAFGQTPGASTQGASGDHTHSLSIVSGFESGTHAHVISGGGTHGATATHAHTITGGATDATAAAVGHENMPPWIAIGQIIRVLPPWRPTP
jgi:microcystin-dependent protein